MMSVWETCAPAEGLQRALALVLTLEKSARELSPRFPGAARVQRCAPLQEEQPVLPWDEEKLAGPAIAALSGAGTYGSSTSVGAS